MGFTVRGITPDERPELLRVIGLAFGFDETDEGREAFEATLETDRTLCAFEGGRMVGTAGAFSLNMTVPGGSLPTAGTTMVSVLPTHRRRGALTDMMHAHFREARDRGDILAALWASESGIYSRFGYGVAAYRFDAEIDRRHAAFRNGAPAPGEVRLLEAAEAREALPAIFEAAVPQRPGMFGRTDTWWDHRIFRDPESERDGASSYRYALFEDSSAGRGYLRYRAKGGWDDDGLPSGQVRIVELLALDPAAAIGLWSYTVGIDLVHTVAYWNLPLDDPLPWLLADPRRLTRRVSDSLWIRLIDVPRALAGRRYSSEGRVVFEVVDDACPWNAGTYELVVSGGRTQCNPTGAKPDLRLPVASLGSVFLGGNPLRTLAGAGLVDGSAEAVGRADRLFSWLPAPWCQEIF